MEVVTAFLVCVNVLCGQTATASISSGSSATRIDTSVPRAEGTVAVGVALSEGLVLAADSRLTYMTNQVYPGYKVLSDFTSKVFDIGKFGVATYGEAFLQDRSIASW